MDEDEVDGDSEEVLRFSSSLWEDGFSHRVDGDEGNEAANEDSNNSLKDDLGGRIESSRCHLHFFLC